MSEITNHVIRVVIGGKQIDGWTSYSINNSMLTPADSFTMQRPFDREAWDLCEPDQEVRVFVDEVQVLFGFIDDIEHMEDEDSFVINGRDRVGRLLQESAPTIEFRGLSTQELIRKLAFPWFDSVVTDNQRNRRVLRGKKGRVALAGSEPVVFKAKKNAGTRVEPGQTRWAAIMEITKQTGQIVWSSGDGEELIVGQPNYNQEPQWFFFRPKPGSKRTAEGNVTKLGEKRSVGDRYSRIDVVGSGSGNAVHYGTAVTSRTGVAKNNPDTTDGDGLDFRYPKRLLMLEGVQSIGEAGEVARREMARRDVDSLRIRVTAPLHGQRINGGQDVTLFACDTLAIVENEATGLRLACLVIGCTFTTSRGDGEQTTLDLIPVGQELFQ